MARKFDRDENTIKDIKNQPISVNRNPGIGKGLGH
jgi:hypothetical protein